MLSWRYIFKVEAEMHDVERFICTVDGALTAWLPWSMGWSSGARHMASRALLVVVEPGAVIIRE